MDYVSENIEHLGVVAGMYEELGIGELLDNVIEQDLEQRQLSIGQCVKAMVLNGLGLAQRRLYLTADFFKNKPVDILLGEGIEASMITSDALAGTLDDIYNNGASELFALASSQAVKRLGLRPKIGHDDVTSFHVDGSYDNEALEDDQEDARLVRLSRGYSRDHRPDLKQIALELIVENEAKLPIAMRTLSGNTNDQTILQESVHRHIEQLQNVGIEVCVKDSAGYNKTALQYHETAALPWIMRVPERITEAKNLVKELPLDIFQPLVEGYSYHAICSQYGETKQRWLVIHSEARQSGKYVQKKIRKLTDIDMKVMKELSKQNFHCQADALKALEKCVTSLKLTTITDYCIIEEKSYAKVGRPTDAAEVIITYKLQLYPASCTKIHQALCHQASRFIIATDILDTDKLSEIEVLTSYKNNQKVESGFAFLKDPMFLANTIFLKKTERIIALMMVMTLCLLVYAAIEHRIRTTLVTHNIFVPDQKRKPTQNPTARWFFQLFLDVHILTIISANQRLTMNLRPELIPVLSALGSLYISKYPSISQQGVGK